MLFVRNIFVLNWKRFVKKFCSSIFTIDVLQEVNHRILLWLLYFSILQFNGNHYKMCYFHNATATYPDTWKCLLYSNRGFTRHNFQNEARLFCFLNHFHTLFSNKLTKKFRPIVKYLKLTNHFHKFDWN